MLARLWPDARPVPEMKRRDLKIVGRKKSRTPGGPAGKIEPVLDNRKIRLES